MYTPLGLSYQPFFPILSSFYKQQEQIKQQKSKAVADAMKTAEERAFQTTKEMMNFDPKFPLVNAYQPFMQTEVNKLTQMVDGLANGSVSWQDVYLQKGKVQKYASHITRWEAAVMAERQALIDSKVGDVDAFDRKLSNYQFNLVATDANGVSTLKDPFQQDAQEFIESTRNSREVINDKAVGEIWMAGLAKTHGAQLFEKNEEAGYYSITKTIDPALINPTLGSSGQHTVNFGPITDGDNPQAAALLNNFLTTMSEKQQQGFKAKLREDYKDEWDAVDAQYANDPNGKAIINHKRGIIMQKALRDYMSDVGVVPYEKEVHIYTPKADDAGSRFIGGTRQTDADATRAAKELFDLFNGEEAARSNWRGLNIVSADIDKKTGEFVMVPKAGAEDAVITMMRIFSADQAAKGGKPFNFNVGTDNSVRVKLTDDNLIQLVQLRNGVTGTKEKWNELDVRDAFKRDYTITGNGVKENTAKGKDTEVITNTPFTQFLNEQKVTGYDPKATYDVYVKDEDGINLDEAPTPNDANEAWEGAPTGMKFYINGKWVIKKSKDQKRPTK